MTKTYQNKIRKFVCKIKNIFIKFEKKEKELKEKELKEKEKTNKNKKKYKGFYLGNV